MFTPLSGYVDLVLLVIRLILGSVMVYYGWPKIQNLKKNSKAMEKMGYKPGWLFGLLNATLEFFGGLAIISGVLAWLAALGFGIQMVLGVFYKTTKTNKPFSDWSYDLLCLAACLAILAFGTGRFAILF
jgi:putative oxidoreductase